MESSQRKRQVRKGEKNNMWQTHNSHNIINMQLRLLPAAHKVLFYAGLCNSNTTVFKVVKIAGYVKLCVYTKTRLKDEKSGAQPMKAKSTRVSFQNT